MDGGVARQLGMERAGEDGALPDQDGLVLEPGEHAHAGTHAPDAGRADEHRRKGSRARVEPSLHAGLERFALPAVAVALHRHVDQRERGLARVEDVVGEQDQAGAGPVDGTAGRVEGAEGGREAVPHQDEERRAFAARDHQAVERPELGGPPHLPDRCPEPVQGSGVSREVSLEGEDTDRERGLAVGAQPRARAAGGHVTTPGSGAARPRPASTSRGPAWPRPALRTPWRGCRGRGSGSWPGRWRGRAPRGRRT